MTPIREIQVWRMKPGFGLVLAAFAFSISACATFQSNPIVSQANSESVTYRIKGNQLDEAREAAEKHCGTFDRRAFQESISRGSGDSRIVKYLCR
ncbi:hypothetical protein [Erythrobacter sp.]|jgi:hypothetical protein|uniref:hypothetical protein n=1 Tax=Erythrobacter sp. TaxID=1042 RepID=UPI002E99D76A|nr:hypothetical protein [Erythrobacter sp.]